MVSCDPGLRSCVVDDRGIRSAGKVVVWALHGL